MLFEMPWAVPDIYMDLADVAEDTGETLCPSGCQSETRQVAPGY